MTDREQVLAQLRARINGPKPEPLPPSTWFRGKGPTVELVQTRLQHHRYYSIEHGDDFGLFGNATEQAVRAFQMAHGLRADAIVGPVTWKALLQDGEGLRPDANPAMLDGG